MKLTQADGPPVIQSGGGKVIDVRFGVSRRAQMKVMDMLTNSLYTDKKAAVLREYACNGADANIEAGRSDTPIEVTLPTDMASELVIRDFGPGMTPDVVENVFSCLGESTKDDSNEVTGMLGIGAKAGFAYGSMFTVVTWQAGTKSIYQFYRDDIEGLRAQHVSTEESNAPDGTEIRVPVKACDFYDFKQKAERVFRYFRVRPIIHGGQLEYKRSHPVFHGDGWRFTGDSKPIAVMGNVGYTIDGDALETQDDNAKGLIECGVELDFAIGELEIAANREGLQYNERTRLAIINKAKKALREITDVFKNQIASATCLWDAKIAYSDAFEKMGDEGKYTLRNIIDNTVTWNGAALTSGRFCLSKPADDDTTLVAVYESRSNGKMHIYRTPEYIYPSAKVLVVENDLEHGKTPPSRIRGVFAKPDHRAVVVFTFKTKKAKAAYWKKCEMEGTPFVQLSTLPPLLAVAGSSNTVKNPKHSAKAFVLDESAGLYGRRGATRSDWWKPETVDLKADKGAYVVLEKFKVVTPGSTEHTESWELLEAVKKLRGVSLVSGKIYGFKNKAGFLKRLGKGWVPLQEAVTDRVKRYPMIAHCFLSGRDQKLLTNVSNYIKLIEQIEKEKGKTEND